MTHIKTIMLGIAIALLPFAIITAQNNVNEISAPWSYGFEDADSATLQYWVINQGADTTICKERWAISSYNRTEGSKCLLITNDGYTPEFGIIANVSYAYMDFRLPAGQYVLSFDWLCMGSADAYLCAGVGIAQQMSNLVTSYDRSSLNDAALMFAGENKELRATQKWQNKQIDISSNGQRIYRLFFGWTNSNRDSIAVPISVSIDNIQITTRNCPRPYNLEAETIGDSTIISWKGTTEQYCLEYRKSGRVRWSAQTGLTSETFIIEDLDEGAYDIRVRGVCNNSDTSAWTYLNAYGVYYPERHCINFVDLYNTEQVTATYGQFSTPYANVGVFDTTYAGSDPKYWRHTVNWDPTEYDPRTGYRLKVIPDDEVASIRLGNWNMGAEAESLSFTFEVDAENQAILLLKYAVVLEDPDHAAASQPHFTLEILDEFGYNISPTCGYADFYADSKREGWYTNGGVVWKDWTVLGLNLAEYDGEYLTIRLTTRDCDWGGHYGYAYFTIGCANATISSTSCGSDSQMSIEAPSGFNYEWFDKYDQPVSADMISTNGRELLINPSDTTTYRCHLSYKEEASCGFDLYSHAYPRFPIASFDWEYIPTECQNRVKFTNKSHIRTEFNGIEEFHYDQECDEYEWDFGTGSQASERNPMAIFPSKGGRFAVTLYSAIGEGQCVDDTTIYITIPSIGDTIVNIDTTICEGSYIILGPQFCGKDSTYSYTWETASGCDSTVNLTINLIPVSNEYAGDTTICAEDPLIIDGQRYKQFPESGQFYRFYTNKFGCDSTIYMDVTVLDSVKPIVVVNDLDNGLNSGSIDISGTGYDYFTINDEVNGRTTGLTNGIYHLEFYNSLGCNVSETVIIGYDELEIQVADTIIVCGDSTTLYVPFTYSGTPVTLTTIFHYMIWFDQHGNDGGFPADTLVADMPNNSSEFTINIPKGVRPGYYTVYIEATNELGEPTKLTFVLRVDFSGSMIFQRWNDVLSLYNAETLGDSVIGFQWLKNGVDIDGAVKSYYYVNNGELDIDAYYSVRLLLPDSTILYTCDFMPIDNPADIQLNPTTVKVGGEVQVRVPTAAVLECYTITGQKIDTQTLNEGISTWQAPTMSGVYVVTITTATDSRKYIISVIN